MNHRVGKATKRDEWDSSHGQVVELRFTHEGLSGGDLLPSYTRITEYKNLPIMIEREFLDIRFEMTYEMGGDYPCRSLTG